MTKFIFIPEGWELGDELTAWTKDKGLSDQQIKDELESFRDHQYRKAMSRPDACWRNWVKNGIRWGRIETVSMSQYRQPEELTPEQKIIDADKAILQMDNYRQRG